MFGNPPTNQNIKSSSNRPIKVSENGTHYLVEISPGQKHRASRIPGRRWDPNQVAWIYPKTIDCYEALKDEFSRDAASFEIRKPKRKPAPQIRPKPVFDDDIFFPDDELKEPAETSSDIHDGFAEVSEKIDVVLKTIRSLEDSSQEIQQALAENENTSEASESEILNGINIEVVEDFLKKVAFESSGYDQSFLLHLEMYQPVAAPERFVMRTHEKLVHALAGICGESNIRESAFGRFVKKIQDEELIEDSHEKRILQTLRILNYHRNQIVHSKDMSDAELKNRALSYLMGVASVWREVASEPVE